MMWSVRQTAVKTMVHAARMAATGDRLESARSRAIAAIDDYAAEMRRVDGTRLGQGLIETRALKDRVEAVFAEGLRRFDQSGEYAADGAIDLVAWLRSKCKLSGGAAAERVGIARQLQHLPQTSKAFATGELGYQHVAVLARTAEHVGAGAVRKAEASLVAPPDAPGGELDGGTIVPAETVRRIACDAAISRIIGKGELDAEITRASRSTPAATRRALAARDRGCVAEHCNRPAQWTDSHHVKHWIDQGPTTMSNLILLCRPHHRKVHEGGWDLQRLATGRWALIRPTPRSRSA